MNIGELKAKIENLDDNLEVFIREQTLTGNIVELKDVSKSEYGFFGKDIECIILEK